MHYLIENKLDLSVFHPKYRNEDTGRLAYDPAILLKIILFAYSKGITSSREMQWCCESNIIFKDCPAIPFRTSISRDWRISDSWRRELAKRPLISPIKDKLALGHC